VIFTIPNLVSALRIAAVPVFVWVLLGLDQPAAAGWILGGIASTDWIDGYLARRLDQVSELGKALDPIADRLAIVAALIGGWIAGVVPWWISLALLTREVVVGVMAAILSARSGKQMEVRVFGKMATWGVYAGIGAFYLWAGTGWEIFYWWAWIYIVPGLILYYVVAIQYFGDIRRELRAAAPVSSG
jgi:cardiolipin synthase